MRAELLDTLAFWLDGAEEPEPGEESKFYAARAWLNRTRENAHTERQIAAHGPTCRAT